MQEQPAAQHSVPMLAYWLGLSGLLPQVLAVCLVVSGGQWGWTALAAGFGYSALIFSFLGGVWWGQAIQAKDPPKWAFMVAVLPSLIGLGLFMPWVFGVDWPGPSLLWLGLLIGVSPLVDRLLGFGDAVWMALRWRLSLGLGGLTLILAMLAMARY